MRTSSDCLAVTISSPKDRAIDKLFYVLFSFSCSDLQPLVLWQCDPWDAFFALIIHKTSQASGYHTQHVRASASAAFAIEIWQAAMVLLVTDRTCLSVPLDIFLLTSR